MKSTSIISRKIWRVYIAPVDDKFGLFWEDGVPIFDDDPDEPAFMIRTWKYRGWAVRHAARLGVELCEPPKADARDNGQ